MARKGPSTQGECSAPAAQFFSIPPLTLTHRRTSFSGAEKGIQSRGSADVRVGQMPPTNRRCEGATNAEAMRTKTTCWPGVGAHTAGSDLLPPPPGAALFNEATWERVAQALRLSGRELQVVRAVFDECTEFAIAEDLRIAPRTVHMHFERLYRKLRVTNRVGLVLRVLQESLLGAGAMVQLARLNEHAAPALDSAARPSPAQAPTDAFLNVNANAGISAKADG